MLPEPRMEAKAAASCVIIILVRWLLVTLLEEIGQRPAKEFIADKILIGSAKYYLQVSIECCLDVANHIIAAKKYRAPKDYADTFAVIGEAGIIEKDLSHNLKQMAKFRNRLVHLYAEIDDQSVYAFIQDDLTDIKAFRRVIVDRYLKL